MWFTSNENIIPAVYYYRGAQILQKNMHIIERLVIHKSVAPPADSFHFVSPDKNSMQWGHQLLFHFTWKYHDICPITPFKV